MKKIIFILIAALTTTFVSCEMNLLPFDAIEESQAVQTMDDAANLRISVYTPVKGLFGGMRWDVEEMRGGLFNAKADFGNYYGSFYIWDMKMSDTEVASPWNSDYGIIAACNFAIQSFEKLLDEKGEELTEEEVTLLNDYIAEAYMTRVMAYWDLVTKYCVAYDPATASQTLGLPLAKEYAPTADRTKYPGRSSLEETYQLILSDLEIASNLSTKGAPNSKYWTIDCVNAMRARVLLNMKNYEDAYDIALNLVQNGPYSLANDRTKLASMWTTDSSSELLFASAGSYQDPPTSTGSYYIYDNSTQDGSTPNSQYLPSQTLVDLYGKTADERAKDMRYSLYFQTRPINVGTTTQNLEVFWKFAGNPLYRSNEKILNYRNAGRPFRLAEQYLILAECAANLGMATDATMGTVKWLNDLRNARIENNTSLPINEQNAMGYVKDEWNREYVGEGFRMINMKRWGDQIVRGASQNSSMTKAGADYDGLTRPITDSRCVWPIPKEEIDANPQIGLDNQNPGY